MGTTNRPWYRHAGGAMLRAAAFPLHRIPATWPALSDTDSCRSWLEEVWALPGFTEATRYASSSFATLVETVLNHKVTNPRQVGRVTLSTMRYLLRSAGRPTPFGMFAGVAAVRVGDEAHVTWGADHRLMVRADTLWLDDVVERLEAQPDLMAQLDVVVSDLLMDRGDRMLGQPGEQHVTIDPDRLVTLHYDIDQPVDTNALFGVLTRERSAVWSDATVHGEESLDRIWLHLSAVDDRTVRIEADPQALASGLCTPAIATRSPALVEGGSLAYFTTRRSDHTPGRWQLGAIGHGDQGGHLAARIVDQINTWDHDRTADPHLVGYPTRTPSPSTAPGKLIRKPNTQLFLHYPDPLV